MITKAFMSTFRINELNFIRQWSLTRFIQTLNIQKDFFLHILLLDLLKDDILLLKLRMLIKAHAMCITVTTMPRKCNREQGRPERLWSWFMN